MKLNDITMGCIETCVISYMEQITSPGSKHDTGCLELVHWDDPEGWYGEGEGRVAQMVKQLPATWETWVQSLGQEDLLEEEMASHSSILAWKIPWTREPEGYSPCGCRGSDMT